MIKREELTNPDSCMSRAREDEMTFVLLERDAAAPVAIRAWINERLRLGKNMGYDKQILNALEVARTMESSPSVPAATQEQPAGSGAKRSDKMEFVKLKFSGVREVVINSCEWKDLQIALKGDRMSYACFEAEEVTAPGSPRKVGEDGPDLFTPEIQRLLDRREAEMDAFHAGPFAYVCPANCGCMWRDNNDGTMSLFGPRSQSCKVCETLPLEKLVPVFAFAMRPSSVPVGEQKQEEGV